MSMRGNILALGLFLVTRIASPLDNAWMTGVMAKSAPALKEESSLWEERLAGSPDDPDLLARVGLCAYMRAGRGEKVGMAAVTPLARSIALRKDPLLKAYLGAAYTILSGETLNLNYVAKGNSLIDEAVAESGGDTHMLNFRLGSSLALPDFLFINREALAKADLESLEAQMRAGTLGAEEAAVMTLHKAEYALRSGDAGSARTLVTDLLSSVTDEQLRARILAFKARLDRSTSTDPALTVGDS